MTVLKSAVNEYLALRRSLGYRLHRTETQLNAFVSFMERQGERHITTKLVMRWVRESAPGATVNAVERLGAVRRFAKFWSAADPRTEVPPAGLIRRPRVAVHPYIYTATEINRLMQAARKLPSPEGFRAHTYYCLLGLLAVTGLRISEAMKLRIDDVNLDEGLLTIKGTKFGKSRLVPLHPTTIKALADYAKRRASLLGKTRLPTFFVNERRSPLSDTNIHDTFVKLRRNAGLAGAKDRVGPRLHDFRHRFAVQTLLNWYRAGEDVERLLPVLSTFLGHSRVQNTYWYLSSAPELLGVASKRLEKRWGGQR